MQQYTLLSEDELADAPAYISLEEALENPDECYILELSSGAESEKSLAQALPKLPRVQQLYFLNNTQVISFPKELAELKNLQLIEIRDCSLETLPEELSQLTEVTDFIMTGCKYVSEFPSFLTGWTDLIYLEITDTKIEEIPAEIGNLTNLEDLNINQNRLYTLPSEIDQLQSLSILRTYGNYAMTLPESLSKLQDLETFDHGLIRVPDTTIMEFRAEMPNTKFTQVTSYDDIRDDDEADF